MDAGGIGALIGVGIMVSIGISTFIYDRCKYSPTEKEVHVFNLLSPKKSSFKVKNLFNHVEI